MKFFSLVTLSLFLVSSNAHAKFFELISCESSELNATYQVLALTNEIYIGNALSLKNSRPIPAPIPEQCKEDDCSKTYQQNETNSQSFEVVTNTKIITSDKGKLVYQIHDFFFAGITIHHEFNAKTFAKTAILLKDAKKIESAVCTIF